MISRRALRIRTFQFLFSYFKQSPPPSVEIVKRQCFQSLDKTYYFYLMMLSLLDEFRILEINDIEKQKNKFIKTNDSKLSVFTKHPFLLALKNNRNFYQKLSEYKVNFGSDKDWVFTIYKNLKQQEFYKRYDQINDPSKEDTAYFIEELLIEHLYNHPLIEHYFEENSQFDLDDLYLSVNLTLKTYEEFERSGYLKIFPPFKDELSDKQFVENLINFTIQYYSTFDDIIAKYSKNWELERINYTDLLLLKMSLVEIMYMPEIPLKTSVDEYIEISKEYSTPQSYVFINGILAYIIKDLKEKDLIKK